MLKYDQPDFLDFLLSIDDLTMLTKRIGPILAILVCVLSGLQSVHAQDLYERLLKGERLQSPNFAKALNQFNKELRTNPKPDSLMEFVKELKKLESPAIGPEKRNQFTLIQNQPMAFRMVLDKYMAEALPASRLEKHPSADLYPGPVPPKAKRVDKTIQVNKHALGWVSTGLYAVAGEKVTVTFPKDCVGKGYTIRIGAQDANLDPEKHPTFRRFQRIIRRFAIRAEKSECGSAFGGLIYVRMPLPPKDPERPLMINRTDIYGTTKDYKPPKPEYFSVKFEGAVEAPHYVHGVTTPAEWRQHQTKLPAPWAEIESEKIVITIPSYAIRDFEHPDVLIEQWHKVLDAMADLSGRPKNRVMPVRIAFDTHISVGLAYCANWIYVPDKFFRKILRCEPDWGPLHELGHVHQYDTWTFQNTTEVTVNLFTLYALEKVHGVRNDHRGPSWLIKNVLPWFDKPVAQRNWKNHPAGYWEKLGLYIVLVEEFGWEPLEEVLAEYREIPISKHPKTEEDRGGDFMYRMSVATQRNLAPFFEAWGVQMSRSYVTKAEQFKVFRSKYLERVMKQGARRRKR